MAVGDFHRRFLKDHSIAIGCPKLDDTRPYVEKLAQILRMNNLRSLTVVHMEVPCCSGLTRVAREAIARSGKPMAFLDITVSLRGSMIRSEVVKVGPEGKFEIRISKLDNSKRPKHSLASRGPVMSMRGAQRPSNLPSRRRGLALLGRNGVRMSRLL